MYRVAIVAALLLLPSTVRAHIELVEPPQRYPAANQFELLLKDGPCGRADNPPGMVGRTTYAPGETITMRWDEFVSHPGHFRVAFDPDGDDDLADPADYDDLYPAGVQVLEDGIPHVNGQSDYELQVTLPDMECSNCTLQLIQVMTDKMPWGPAGGTDLYYQCADIELKAGGGSSGGGTGSSGGDSSTSSSTSSSSTGGSTASSGEDTTSATGGATGADATSGEGGSDTDGGSSGNGDGSGCRVGDADGAWALLFVLLLPGRRRGRADRWQRPDPGATVRR